MSAKLKRPWGEVMSFAESLLFRLEPRCARIEIAGSLRRHAREVGDIELVAIPRVEEIETARVLDIFGRERITKCRINRLWAAIDNLQGLAYSKRGEKYRQFSLPLDGGGRIQVDVFTAEPGNWGWQFLVRTGSAEFSHMIAHRLNQRGYTSEEAWIRRHGDPASKVPTPTEEDVFTLVGMQFVPPEARNL